MRRLILFFACMAFAVTGSAQQQQSAPATKPAAPADRLATAKNLFIKTTGGGSEIPYNVISSDFEGWGKYVLVDSAEKADIVMEISAPKDDSGTRISTKVNRESGQQENGYSSSKELSSDPIKITVYDAKSKKPLWSATDKPKFAMKQKAKENSLVESSGRLFSRFHDRVEPKVGVPLIP